jgi:putrescine transport system permease protein
VFFLLPFLVVLKIAVSEMGAVHPRDVLVWQDGSLDLHLRLDAFALITSDALYLRAMLRSLGYAAATALLCLLFGYPFAYFIARARRAVQPALVMLVLLPFWTSYLLRAYAWKGLLSPNGWVHDLVTATGLDQLLLALGLIAGAGQLMNSPFALLLGMSYTYLPFMVLPLVATLSRMDLSLVEAAQDLGASRWQTFWSITVPLSRSGIVAGTMLVFIPCVGEFVIPELLGGPRTLMIGRVIWDELFTNNDWPVASALAVLMIVLILAPLVLLERSKAHAAGGLR